MTQGVLGCLGRSPILVKKSADLKRDRHFASIKLTITSRFQEPEEALAAGRQDVAGDVHRAFA